jgi:hypothetical protein
VLARVEEADPRDQLRLLVALVVDIAERDPVGIALQAHASHPIVGPALERVTWARIEGTMRLFARLGFRPAEARRRALLAYSAYLGHAQLAHSTPVFLPATAHARQAYLDHVLRMLTA